MSRRAPARPARPPPRADGRDPDRMRFDVNATDTGTSATEAFAHRPRRLPGLRPCLHRRGPPSRHPARYVGGYLFREDGRQQAGGRPRLGGGAGRRLGWVGFDPANNIARPTPMSGSPPASTISARPRSAAHAMAARAKPVRKGYRQPGRRAESLSRSKNAANVYTGVRAPTCRLAKQRVAVPEGL